MVRTTIVFLITLNLIVPIPIYGQCTQHVTPLNQGQAAPCDGFLFTPAKEEDIRNKIDSIEDIREDNELLKNRNQVNEQIKESYRKELLNISQILDKKDEQAEKWKKRATESTEKLIDSESSRGSRDALMIGIGIALTVISSIIVKNVSKR